MSIIGDIRTEAQVQESLLEMRTIIINNPGKAGGIQKCKTCLSEIKMVMGDEEGPDGNKRWMCLNLTNDPENFAGSDQFRSKFGPAVVAVDLTPDGKWDTTQWGTHNLPSQQVQDDFGVRPCYSAKMKKYMKKDEGRDDQLTLAEVEPTEDREEQPEYDGRNSDMEVLGLATTASNTPTKAHVKAKAEKAASENEDARAKSKRLGIKIPE